MVGPGVSPRRGIAGYEMDPTQGPKCAIACPAGTAYRNYLVPLGKDTGQCGDKQINTLEDIEAILGTRYWEMQNGYGLPINTDTMAKLTTRLQTEDGLADALHNALRVGVQWDTMVGTNDPSRPKDHRVCQVYASACCVAYAKSTKSADWAAFASLVLNAAYDATLLAGRVLSMQRNKRITVYLTHLGGGAFGNRDEWILAAVQGALDRHRDANLDVRMVHYGRDANAAWRKVK